MKKELYRFRMFHEAEQVCWGAVGSALGRHTPISSICLKQGIRGYHPRAVDQSVPDTGADDGAVALARVSHPSKGLDSITHPNNSGFNDLGVNCKTGSGMSWQ